LRLHQVLWVLLSILIITNLSCETNELIVNKIEFVGLTSLTNAEAQKALNLSPLQPFQPELIDVIKSRTLSALSDKGIYFASIEKVDIIPAGIDKVTILVYVMENIPTDKAELRIVGNRYFSEAKIFQLLNIRTPQSIKLQDLPKLEQGILKLYTDRAFLFASVSLDSLRMAEDKLIATVRIEEGPLFKLNKLRVTGNKVTKERTIIKIAGISYIQQFTPDALTQAEDNLLKKAYIKTCRITPLDASTLNINVEEDKMTLAQGVLGISTNPQTKKREFSGIVNFDFLNLWGTDRALSLYWKKLKSSYQMLELKYHESGWENYPYSGDVAFQRIEQDSAWISLKAELSVYYNSLYYKLGSYVNSETLYPASSDSTAIDQTSYNRLGLLYDYTKIDYTPNPTQGYRFQAKTGWMFSRTESKSKTVPTFELDYSNYLTLRPKVVNAISLHYREISDANAQNHEQYKMGGFNSLRGYNEDVFSSYRLGWINWELRYLLERDSRFFLLLDYGVFQEADKSLKSDIWGGGMGFALKTKVGVLGISYALAYIDNQLKDINSGMLHIGLESSF
jgi:outer membrane protein assembly factor BamA